MQRILASALPAFAVTAGFALAEPVALTAPEIETLLEGNTAVGSWSGTPYRQFFDPSGRTIYAPENSRPEQGRWRANHDTDRYESHWERSGWSAYGIARDGATFFWVEGDGDMQAFVIEAGNSLSQ